MVYQMASTSIGDTLMEYYLKLYDHYGPQGWWPGDGPLETIVGAILTQFTSWRNVERALDNLKSAGAMSVEALRDIPTDELALLIRPPGAFNQKARRSWTASGTPTTDIWRPCSPRNRKLSAKSFFRSTESAPRLPTTSCSTRPSNPFSSSIPTPDASLSVGAYILTNRRTMRINAFSITTCPATPASTTSITHCLTATPRSYAKPAPPAPNVSSKRRAPQAGGTIQDDRTK